MSLLPSKPDTSAAEESAPRVVGVDSEDADELLNALSSTTARRILSELHDEPAPPSAVADRVDTSLQNVQYHLENLADAGAVEVIDTAYSEKGREMDVYAPADRPLVIFAGQDEQTGSIRAALRRLLGGVGVLALGSLVVQALVDGLPGLSSGSAGGDSGGEQSGGLAATETTGDTPAETPAAGQDTAMEGETTDATGVDATTPTDDAAGTPEPTTETGDVSIFGTGEEETTTTVIDETTRMVNETAQMANGTTEEATRLTAEGIANATANGTTAAMTTPPGTTTTAADATTAGVTGTTAVPPGLLFFAGGAVVLLGVVAFQYVE